ncbi:50S ribosomal protein L11 methyltransferase [Tistrella sp. BH-R2-4]|uniref:50S ribosomal protein L11 methyltransferase n=1 Tax=Tistrella arctica TaxID=3133430 RepID=A0ABU9YNX9_9PROT
MPISADSLAMQLRDKPLPLVRLAAVLWAKGKKDEAQAACLHALEVGADQPEVVMLARDLLARDVPKWHFAIVRDQVRNDAYEAALKRAVGPESHVMEIGTGSGILSMMAARAGAGRVTTFEMNPMVADAARRIIARNGHDDRITLVAKKSSDALVGEDVDGRADILVQEIISNDLLGEAVLPAIEDATKRLLKPGARMIPAVVAAQVALIDDEDAGHRRMDTVSGFDLSDFNHLGVPFYRMSSDRKGLSLRSEPVELMRFDLQSGGPFPSSRTTATLTANGGRVTGIVQWLKMDMDDKGDLIYENRPGAGVRSCWAVRIFPLDQPRDLAPGTTVRIGAQHDRNTIMIWCDGVDAAAATTATATATAVA